MNEKWQTGLTWGKRIAIVTAILFALGYGVLSLAQRQPEPIRMGLEDYLEEATGNDARITEMTKVRLVPSMAFGMTGVALSRRGDPGKTLVKADRVYMSMPFWTIASGSGDYLALQAEGVEIASGVFLPRKTDLEFAGISDTNPQSVPASFMIQGTYNALPLLITAEMTREAGRKFYRYHFEDSFPVTFKLGELEGDGIYDMEGKGVTLRKVQLFRPPHRAEFVLRNVGAAMEAEGTINGVDFKGKAEKDGDKVVLRLTPTLVKADDDKRVMNFIRLIEKDMGTDDPSTPFKITVDGIEPQE